MNNERGCLLLFYTLRNRADPEFRKNVKTYLKTNDYVRSRDRQNPSGELTICKPGFLAYIGSSGKFICRLCPERATLLLYSKGNELYCNIIKVKFGTDNDISAL